MKKQTSSLFYMVGVLALTLAVLVGSVFVNQAAMPSALSVYQTALESGEVISSSSITDISGVHKFEAINFTPDEYGKLDAESVKAGQYTPAQSGTYRFLITNINPTAEDFNEQAQKLEYLLKNDQNWHLTMYLPPVLSACNIYVRYQLKNAVGELEEYSFIDFYNNSDTTESHKTKTEPVFIDLTLFANRKFLSLTDEVHNGCLVTIHCEAPDGKAVMIDGDILIGEDSAVRAYVTKNKVSTYVAAVISAVAFGVLLFVSIMKRRIDFLPQAIFVLGILGIFLCNAIYWRAIPAPYAVKAFKGLSYAIIGIGGAHCCKERLGKFPARAVLVMLSLACAVIAFWIPLADFKPAMTLFGVLKYLNAALAISVAVCGLLSAINGARRELCIATAVCPTFILVATFATFGLEPSSPLYALSVLLLGITVYLSFREFVITERAHIALTANLQAEVERQTYDLKRIIAERDKLLRYISHDLKKPVVGIKQFLPLLDSGDEHTKNSAMQNIMHKIDGIEENLNEIQKFSKINYVAEPSGVIELAELLRKIYDDLRPDCEANSVRLKLSVKNISVYAKSVSLNSVIRNLLFNALEHSGCSQINISAYRKGSLCCIDVCDDGHGIDGHERLFTPYNTDSADSDNLGIGLYISKQQMNAMGGDLTYKRRGDTTIFTATLPTV